METNVFIEYDGNEIFIGTVREIQSLAGPECNEVAQTFNGKAVLFLINHVLSEVVEQLLYDETEPEEKKIIVRIR